MNDQIMVVKISEMSVVKNQVKLKITLGSCIGLILYDEKRGKSGLAHIMLPKKLNNDTVIGKYVETAVPALLKQMIGQGCRKGNIRAYLIGGANMFQHSNEKIMTTVGEKNIDATNRLLGELEIPIIFEDIGGNCGRTVMFDSTKGEVSVKTLSKTFHR